MTLTISKPNKGHITYQPDKGEITYYKAERRFFFPPIALQPKVGHGVLILDEVS